MEEVQQKEMFQLICGLQIANIYSIIIIIINIKLTRGTIYLNLNQLFKHFDLCSFDLNQVVWTETTLKEPLSSTVAQLNVVSEPWVFETTYLEDMLQFWISISNKQLKRRAAVWNPPELYQGFYILLS